MDKSWMRLHRGNAPQDAIIPDAARWNISVVSQLVIPKGHILKYKLSRQEVEMAHWCVMDNCDEAEPFINTHLEQLLSLYPGASEKQRIASFIPHFHRWMNDLQIKGDTHYNQELQILSCQPQAHNVYSQCEVNGVNFVTNKRRTQNSGVMVESDGIAYYGVLDAVVELKYPEGMSVVLFKCKWFNTDPHDPDSTKSDRGLLLVNTSTSWYEDSPYILAKMAKQVFYIDDPVAGANWAVVNVMSHRGTYTKRTLARDETIIPQYEVNEPYQEPLEFLLRHWSSESQQGKVQASNSTPNPSESRTESQPTSFTLPFETQLSVIREEVGERKGTTIRGSGSAIRKDPKMRGGARNANTSSEATPSELEELRSVVTNLEARLQQHEAEREAEREAREAERETNAREREASARELAEMRRLVNSLLRTSKFGPDSSFDRP